MRKKLLFIIISLIFCFGWGTYAETNSFYQVYRVKKGESLTLRKQPNFQSSEVVSIPYNTTSLVPTGLLQKVGKNQWHEIEYQGNKGWVNGFYLKVAKGKVFQESLDCLGTEPFWSASIKKGKLSFQDLSGNKNQFLINHVQDSLNHTNQWALATNSSKSGKSTVFLQKTNQCSDDMSDFEYKYQIFIFHELLREGFSGCCNRK